MMPTPRILLSYCFVALAAHAPVMRASIAQPPPGAGGPPPARVTTDKVRLETVERWREVTGELRAPLRSTLATQRAGLVVQLNVEAGDRIEAGRVVAKLDDRTARLEVEQAEAKLATSQANAVEREALMEKARRDLQRMDTSFNKAGATQSELDDARSNLAIAESRIAQSRTEIAHSQAEVRLAQKSLDDLTIKAPFSGTIIAKRTEVGQWVTEGGAIAELIALDMIDAWLDVPEGLAERLRPGLVPAPEAGSASAAEPAADPSMVQIRLPSLASLTENSPDYILAPVAGIVPSGDPRSRLFPVRVRLENKDNRLKPGMSVVGLVPSGDAEQALTLSKDALLRNETGPFVYYSNNGVAAIAPVTVLYGASTGGAERRLVVRSPMLSEGVEVVIEGNERIFPGQPLIKLNTAEQDTSATKVPAKNPANTPG